MTVRGVGERDDHNCEGGPNDWDETRNPCCPADSTLRAAQQHTGDQSAHHSHIGHDQQRHGYACQRDRKRLASHERVAEKTRCANLRQVCREEGENRAKRYRRLQDAGLPRYSADAQHIATESSRRRSDNHQIGVRGDHGALSNSPAR